MYAASSPVAGDCGGDTLSRNRYGGQWYFHPPRGHASLRTPAGAGVENGTFDGIIFVALQPKLRSTSTVWANCNKRKSIEIVFLVLNYNLLFTKGAV